MLIRSQNKEFLVNFDGAVVIEATMMRDLDSDDFAVHPVIDIYDFHELTANDGYPTRILGEYATEERCIDLLDGIQSAYENGVIAYQMPEE